mmetsp:Transcript_33324/g.46619  ORF Transcript_33324/g.46619 Transcript_33324/m.46619 type:complete len:557 (+) Transcript_33324:56-1726(+)
MSPMFFAVMVLAFVAIFVASGVGMGGGGILVPMYTILLAFPSKSAVALSNITIFGGSIVNVAIYFRRKHPLADRPLIDWDLIMVMEPVTILGALAGSFINKLLPGWLTSIFLVIVLTITTYRLLKKAIKLYQKESTDMEGTLEATVEEGVSDLVLNDDMDADFKEDDGMSLRPDSRNIKRELGAQSSYSPLSFFARLFSPRPHGPAGEDEEVLELRGREELGAPSAQSETKAAMAQLTATVDTEIREISAAMGGDDREEANTDIAAATGDEGDGADVGSGCTDEEKKEAAAANNEDAKVGITGHISSSRGSRSKRPLPAQAQDHENLVAILAKESELPPWWKVGAVTAIFACVLVLTISRGFVECGSAGFFLLVFLNLPIVGIAMYILRKYLIKQHRLKQACGYDYIDGDVRWDERATVLYPAICAVAGIFAGMFGIGGGIIKQPLMLEMSILPEVAVATSCTMIFFTTGAATVSYLTFGLLTLDNGVPFFIVGFLATIGGNNIMRLVLSKLNRKSLILFAVAGIIALSTLLMTIASVRATLTGKTHISLCSSTAE